MRLIAAFILFALPVAAQTPSEAAQAAVQRLEAAGVGLTQAAGARDRVKALTETVQAYEDGLIAMREGVRRAAIRQAALELELAERRDEVSQLLGVLQSIGRTPTPLLLLHPAGPIGTARSGMIVADVTPALHAEADKLRDQLTEVAQLRDLQENAALTLQEGLAGAQTARAALSLAISQRSDLPLKFVENPVQTALLLASTETLAAFAAGLSDSFLTDAAPGDVVTANGDLPLPVRGRLLRGFNEADAAGIARPGVIISANARSLVTTPISATVLFRGPLLDYGNVIILEPAADVLFVIAGLAEVFGEAGEVLPAGSPIGLLGGDQPEVDANLNQSAANGGIESAQTLYLEVREGQSPVNPATWFVLE